MGHSRRECVEPQEALGMILAGLFCDADDPDKFIWLRGFEDMHARRAALAAFYGGPVWKTHRDAANGAMVDSDDVFLLRPVLTARELQAPVREPLFCVTRLFDSHQALRDFARSFNGGGAALIAAFETEPSPNNFPALPVRADEHAFVAVISGAARSDLAGQGWTETIELLPTKRSRLRYG